MTLANTLYTVVRGKDSVLDIPLTENGELVPSDGITRCDLVFKREGVADLTISSSVNPSWFTLQHPESLDDLDLSIVRVNLRQIPTPPADGRYKVDVFLWDEDFVNGRLWGTIDTEIRPAIPVP